MINIPPNTIATTIRTEHHVLRGNSLAERMPSLVEYVQKGTLVSLTKDPRWLDIFQKGMGHETFVIEARNNGKVNGLLPLVHLKSWLFGNRLVSLPYVNTSGVLADTPEMEQALVRQAIQLADQLQVKSLELRHESRVEVASLSEPAVQKIHMRLPLPPSVETLWKAFDPKVRNQIRKAEKHQLTINWGAEELLPAFYSIFARNMRDLGTPVFGLSLFRSILQTFRGQAEICVVNLGQKPIAAGLLLHGNGITEVPSASSLREHNSTCANMLMYWHLLQRAIERSQSVFDFGRSSPDSPTYQFKKQWGAEPYPAVWQYYLRQGSASDMRPDNPKYRLMIKTWKKMPVWLTRMIGPSLARVIP